MAVLEKGNFTLNLGLIRLSGTLSDLDRQCAWELYTELSTRVAVTGKDIDLECKDFTGELYIESLQSLFKFFQESREIMKKFPVGKLEKNNKNHLGVLIYRILRDVLRPFLEKWQVEYRHWWENKSNPRLPPMERQREFPQHEEFISDWTSLRWLMRKTQVQLVETYKLVDIV